MSSIIAALHGKLGSTEYYLFCMKVQELVSNVRFIQPDEWKDMSVEEKFQREIKKDRILRDIVPYLVNNDDRFFGSVIVAAENFVLKDKFDPISKFCDPERLTSLHKSESLKMGFLTFSGGEQLVPLDGQHRVQALQYAIKGKDDSGKDVPCRPELAQEDVAVILVDFDRPKARRIFTQVNKNARAITRGQSLATDDEDKLAVLSRKIADEFIGGPMVNHISSTLGVGSPEFTTLNALYEGNKIIIEAAFGKSMVDKCVAPAKSTELSDEEMEACRQEIGRVWDALLKGISLFVDALKDKSARGDDKRKEIRKDFLIGKPLPQVCLVRAYVQLTKGQPEKPETKLSSKEAIAKLNRIPWENENRIWQNVLWSGKRILTTKKNTDMATDLIAYMAGEQLTNEERGDLLERYREFYHPDDRGQIKLPSPI